MQSQLFQFLVVLITIACICDGLEINPRRDFTILTVSSEQDRVEDPTTETQTDKHELSRKSSNRIHVNIRGRNGIIKRNGTAFNKPSNFEVPITWDEAYSQAVKRVSRPNTSPGAQRRRKTPTTPKTIFENPVDPPPHEQFGKMARFLVHNSNWTTMATISTQPQIFGLPFANILSVSDGPVNKSSGIPYFYMTPLDMSAKDLKTNSNSSLTMSLAQSDYCKSKQYDPEDPRCGRVILNGRIIRLDNTTVEESIARDALFSRHPDMEGWPQDHGWFFAKLEISHILVLDFFGGAKSVTLKDYYDAV